VRAIVIADCHGRPDLITNALEHAKYDGKKDRFIFAGDFLDIGNDPDKCLEILTKNNAEMLWGNHEVSVLLKKPVVPQSVVSWEYQGVFQHLVRSKAWKVAAAHAGVLITHAGVSQVYWRALGGYEEMGADYVAHYFNSRFEVILDVPEIAMDFWASDSLLWFRPDLLAPLPGIVQVVGHTPPELIPLKDRDFYISVDPYTTNGFGPDRFRYAIIEDDEVFVFDSNEA